MLSLRLFGGLSLSSSDAPVPVRASQRRRLALLAILATARARPIGRDKLVALLWPDSDGDSARHLLADSLYVLRDSLGEYVLLATGDTVSLNSSLITSDFSEFADAIDRRELARAVSIYSAGGQFLDGVHLNDVPEFERWVDATSRQVSSDYARALESLAKEAAATGNHTDAVEWWRKLAAQESSSSRVALELMHALEASGDISGALEFAGVHEKIVKAELDAPPDPSIVNFANELRAKASTPASASRKSAGTTREAPVSAASVSNAPTELPAQPHADLATEVVSRSPAYPRRALIGGLAVVTVLALSFALSRLSRPVGSARESGAARASIAVLPFRSVTPGADNEAFADGITEELIGSLSKMAGLRVIASTSVFAFKGHPTDVRRIADSLRVANVLEGAAQRLGSRVRLSVRLVDAVDGSTRWSETYDRTATDLFSVEDEIGGAVGKQLSAMLGTKSAPPIRHQTVVPRAYDLYLRGLHQRELRNDTAFKAAIQYFRQAIAADSSYAPAYAALSEASAILAWLETTPELPRSRLFASSEISARKALQLDDSLPEAHLAAGFLAMVHQINFSVAETELRSAVELDPGSRRAHEYLADVFDWTGRADLGIAEARRAEDLDPLSVTAMREVGRALYTARRYDEALMELDRARSMGPTLRNAPEIIAQVYAKKKMYPQAIAELKTARGGYQFALLGHMYGLAGDHRDASRILTEVIARYAAGRGGAFEVATVYTGLHDYDNAFAWLDKSFQDSSIWGGIMAPLFDDLRADPRFEHVRSRLGIQKL